MPSFHRFAAAALLAFTPLIFAGCGDPAESETVPADAAVRYESFSGMIRPLSEAAGPRGTHRLESAGQLVALLESKNPSVNLDSYLNQSVELEGIVRPLSETSVLRLVEVVSVSLADAKIARPTGSKTFTDAARGFEFRYPAELTARATSRGAQVLDGNSAFVEVAVLANPAEADLAAWLKENYGFAETALNPIITGQLTGYSYQNPTGQVAYLAFGKKIFALAWLDTSETNRTQHRRQYLEILQSFAVTDSAIITGSRVVGFNEACGVSIGARCAAGLTCQLAGTTGTCQLDAAAAAAAGVAASSVTASTSLPALTQLEADRGWYYGDLATKKPGTPDSWQLVDAGTQFAMWRRREGTEPEYSTQLPQATTPLAQLPADQRQVADYLLANINALAPEKPTSGTWAAQRIGFFGRDSVFVIYAADRQTRRIIGQYSAASGSIQVTIQAYSRPGPANDWVLKEGTEIAIPASTVVDPAVTGSAAVAADGTREYSNETYKFSLWYPADWFWRQNGANRIEFSEQPFPRGLARITAQIVPGSKFAFDELNREGELTIVYLALDQAQSLRLSSTAEYAEQLASLARTFKKN